MASIVYLVMMVKNESNRILVTLDSVKDIVKGLIIYDTGSEDNTIDLIKYFVEQNNNVSLFLLQGTFENFEISRNKLLDFADTVSTENDFYLLMDCNDELKQGDKLLSFAQNEANTLNTAYYVKQHWYHGGNDEYINIRFLKAKKGLWRYKGVVHEFLYNTTVGWNIYNHLPTVPDVVIFQDRTKDDNKSFERQKKDYVLLLEEHNKCPDDPRTTFYLAQTCECIKKTEEAYKYYKERMTQEGFLEERYTAALKLGIMKRTESETKPEIEDEKGVKRIRERTFKETVKAEEDWAEALGWFMRCYDIYKTAEPLLNIADHYGKTQTWDVAYSFLQLSMPISYPDYLVLFNKSRYTYDYTKNHLAGILCYYVGKYKEGLEGAKKAFEYSKQDTDLNNLKYYENKLKELKKKKKKGGKKKD